MLQNPTGDLKTMWVYWACSDCRWIQGQNSNTNCQITWYQIYIVQQVDTWGNSEET